MHRTLDFAHVALHGEMNRPPSLPRDPPIPLHDDSYIESIGRDQPFSYAHMCRDNIHDTWRVHDPHDTHQVHIYMELLTLIIKLYIIYINKFVSNCIYINKFIITCIHNPTT